MDQPQMGVTLVAHVFIYGTLLDLELLEIVLGHAPRVRPAMLPDCRSAWVDGHEFPMIYRCDGAQANGVLLDASKEDITRLDFYEGPFSYDLERVEVSCEGEVVEAQTYFPASGRYSPGRDWLIEDWSAEHGALRRFAAVEIMDRFGVMNADEVSQRYPVILARAQQRLNAQTSQTPCDIRVNSDAQRIEVTSKTRLHDGWFMTEALELSHPKYDGSQSRVIRREVFVMADAVTVLPYDPVTDQVMLIEQFRAGLYRRGDPHPWSLEVIAGRVDGGETYAAAAHREAREEAGLELKELAWINGYYPSPAAATEYLVSYVGLADLSGAAVGGGGLDSEDEDIRAIVMPFDKMMATVASGEANNAPLLISAYWLAANRKGLTLGG